MFSKRLFTFFIIMPFIFLAVVFDKWVFELRSALFFGVSLIFQVILSAELIDIAGRYLHPLFHSKKKYKKYKKGFSYFYIIISSALLYTLAWIKAAFADTPLAKFLPDYGATLLIAALFLLIVFIAVKVWSKDHKEALAQIMIFGLILIMSFFYSFLIAIKALDHGVTLLFFYLTATWGNDALAYSGGMLLGRHKAKIPASPNKSWEGFLCGALGTWAAYFLFCHFAQPQPDFIFFHSARGIAATAVITLLCPLGDLIESVIKRSAGVKHSGDLIPGRGGVFDSLDSILFGLPFFYAIISYFH